MDGKMPHWGGKSNMPPPHEKILNLSKHQRAPPDQICGYPGGRQRVYLHRGLQEVSREVCHGKRLESACRYLAAADGSYQGNDGCFAGGEGASR